MGKPIPEKAIQSPALPVLTGHAIGCPLAGGSGQVPPEIIAVVVVVVVVVVV